MRLSDAEGGVYSYGASMVNEARRSPWNSSAWEKKPANEKMRRITRIKSTVEKKVRKRRAFLITFRLATSLVVIFLTAIVSIYNSILANPSITVLDQ